MSTELADGILTHANSIIHTYHEGGFVDRLNIHVRADEDRRLFERIVKLAHVANIVDWRLCPPSEIDAAGRAFKRSIDLFDAVREITKTPIPADSRMRPLLTQVVESECELYDLVSGSIALWLVHENKYIEQKLAVDAMTTSLKNELDDAIRAASAKRKELAEVSKGLGDTVAMITAGLNGKFFNAEAEANETARNWWLGFTVLFACSVAGFVIFVANKAYDLDPKATAETSYLVQTGLAKALVFSALLTGTLWCGRMFKAYSHNFIVNRHRANAINSFLQMMHMNPSQSVKDAALIAVTQCIFSHQSSGLVDDKADGEVSSRIIEITRDAIGRK